MSTQPSIAIVGSGPSGCYLAQSLRKHWPDTDVTVFDQLATPYGLVRYGVASDHQNTKAVTRQFDRLFEREGVRFAGNIRVGRDVTLEQLREAYSVVAFATGLTKDRPLGVEGDDLTGVFGAGDITRALNAHPDSDIAELRFGDRVVVIGNGNVAMDIIRFLLKHPEDYAGSDVNDTLVTSYDAHRAKRIDVVGRSGIAAAKCDALMLRELGKVANVRFETDAALDAPDDADRDVAARFAAVNELVSLDSGSTPDTEVVFHFGWTPGAVRGDQKVESVEFVATGDSSKTLTLDADSVIAAIGFELHDDAPDMFGDAPVSLDPTPETGRFGDGLYRTGWFKRGPRGTIPENRADAKQVADEIISDFDSGVISVRPEQTGFEALPEEVQQRAISFVDWQRLDAHEQAEAASGRIRKKVSDHQTMLSIARG